MVLEKKETIQDQIVDALNMASLNQISWCVRIFVTNINHPPFSSKRERMSTKNTHSKSINKIPFRLRSCNKNQWKWNKNVINLRYTNCLSGQTSKPELNWNQRRAYNHKMNVQTNYLKSHEFYFHGLVWFSVAENSIELFEECKPTDEISFNIAFNWWNQ